jgi:oligoendopeptidase F
MAETKAIPERSAVPEQYTWKLSDMFATDEAWQAAFDKARAMTAEAAGYAGCLGESAETLYTYVTLEQDLFALLSELANYAIRKSDQDTRDAATQAMSGKIMSLYVEVSGAVAFETPELLQIAPETLERFYTEKPELAVYRRYFSIIQEKKAHILSDAEEKLLAAAGELTQAPEDIFSKLTNADLTFADAVDSQGQKHPVSNGSYVLCLESSDRVLRKSAYESMYATYGGIKNTAAAVLSAQVKSLQFYANARHYGSTLESALDSTRVPTAVYHNLIDVVNRNLDKLHRYVRLRKKLLGLDELYLYDLYTPMVAGVSSEIPYEQAQQTVLEALKPMGEDYLSIIREGFSNRWIDVYENVGKRSGAYSAGALTHPYVLLNYKDNLDSMFTLAHEMGHAVHSYLSNRNQPPVYRDYVIFVAEVASTCNEALLMEDLLKKTTDKKARIYLLNHFLDQFKGTLYRQTMFAEFELRINELSAQGESLTADLLCSEYKTLNAKYYGDAVVTDDLIALEWSRIPHFYYNYYVFQYATGYAAAIALSRKILAEGAPAVQDYLQFLSGGCSKDPIDLLKGAGVDMASPAPIQSALDLFDQLLDEMEALTEA